MKKKTMDSKEYLLSHPPGTTTLPDDKMPKFPDGSFFEDVRHDAKQAALCKGILDSYYKTYELGPEHTLTLMVILRTTMTWDTLMQKEVDDPKFIKEASSLADMIVKYQKELGLLKKRGQGRDPYTLWDSQVYKKAIPYMRELGLGTTVACPNCGTFVLPYIHSLPVKCDSCGKKVLYKGLKHPWINWDKYPIWSDEVWQMMHRECGHTCSKCGNVCTEPKLSMKEAGFILSISEVAVDQLEQMRIDGTMLEVGADGDLHIRQVDLGSEVGLDDL
jgi:hypothetical protein